jgi:hypothetical protein
MLRAGGVFILVCALQLFLYAHLPEARRNAGWPTIVMHNWHEYGYWPLHGQLVANPGGLEPGEEKYVYPGHQPFFLIIPYLLKELPGAAGGDGVIYDFALLALTYAALLFLLGTGGRGILVASAVCLAPGFLANVAGVDTIAIPALVGIGALAYAGGVLAENEAKLSARLAALAVMLVFMLLNWSTLFCLGIAAVYVLCRRTDWKNTLVFFAAALVIGLAVLAVSMHSKHATTSQPGALWNSYLWGPLGYDGAGMTLGKALVRITAVNVIAWLPVALAGLAALCLNGPGKNWRRAAWPLLASIAAVFTLRNYSAHHPWNFVSEIGLGLVFSIELLTRPEGRVAPARDRLVAAAAAIFFSGYLAAWFALDGYNGRDLAPLRTLVVDHTPRHALIVVADGLMPAGVKDLKPFTEEFDRKLVSLDEWNQPGRPAAAGREVFLLAHTSTAPGAVLVAQSEVQTAWADRLIAPLFDFYRSKISRRAPGNRKEYFEDYRLYKF